jgi:hypothetical protein
MSTTFVTSVTIIRQAVLNTTPAVLRMIQVGQRQQCLHVQNTFTDPTMGSVDPQPTLVRYGNDTSITQVVRTNARINVLLQSASSAVNQCIDHVIRLGT